MTTCAEPRSENSDVPLDSHQHRAHLNLTDDLIHEAGIWHPCAPSSSRPRLPVINLPPSALPVTFSAQVDAFRARKHLPSYLELIIDFRLGTLPFGVSVSSKRNTCCPLICKKVLLDARPSRGIMSRTNGTFPGLKAECTPNIGFIAVHCSSGYPKCSIPTDTRVSFK